MAWPPAAAKLVVNVAVPSGPTAKVPRTTVPSMKVTVPVGVLLPAGPRTVAVNVTACPTTAGLRDGARATVVGAGVTVPGLTVTVTTAEVLAGKAPLRRTAFSAWAPTPPPTHPPWPGR